jgi:nicotinamide-nucleotide amidase
MKFSWELFWIPTPIGCAKQVSGRGGRVVREVLVQDDVGDVCREIKEALARKPARVISMGGLGPTEDDLTLKAAARAWGTPLEQNEEAYAWVCAFYEKTFGKHFFRGYGASF